MAAGAHLVLPLSELTRSVAKRLAGSSGAAIAFCTRGGSLGIQAAIKAVARGGRIILYQSIPNDDTLTVSSNDVHYRELMILGTVAQTARDFSQAAAIVSMAPTMFDCLVVETVSPLCGRDAFDRAILPGINRVQVDFRELKG